MEEPYSLFEPIKYIMEDGGKRLRPVLTLMAYNLYRDDIEKALKSAIGIEIFHNYTLLHDDVMDDAELRRGRQTVHKKWNSNVAIQWRCCCYYRLQVYRDSGRFLSAFCD